MSNKEQFTNQRDYESQEYKSKKLSAEDIKVLSNLKTTTMKTTKEEIINVLRSAFDSLDYISDMCDDEQTSPSECLEQIRLTANGELAELEELIIKLQQ